MPAAGCELKKTLPCTLALPAAGRSFSTPAPEEMTPSSPASAGDAFAFAPAAFALAAAVFALAGRAGWPEFKAPEKLQPNTKAAKSKAGATAPFPLVDMGFVLLESCV